MERLRPRIKQTLTREMIKIIAAKIAHRHNALAGAFQPAKISSLTMTGPVPVRRWLASDWCLPIW